QTHVACGFGIALVRSEAGYARPETALDVILQARARVGARQIHAAGRNEKPLVDKVQNAASQARGKIGAEVERAIFFDTPREVQAGKYFRRRYDDEWIGVSVGEDEVEPRAG